MKTVKKKKALGNLLFPKAIENKDHWTNKTGKKIGQGIDFLFSNKKFKIIFTVLLLALVFIFIVPIQNNIVTLILLTVLCLLHLLCNKKTKNS